MHSSAAARPIPATIRNPKAVMKDPTLSSSAKVLYQNLVNDADERGTVDLYMHELARDLGVTENRAGALVAELRRAELIQTHQRGRRPLSFTLIAIAAAFAMTHAAPAHAAEQLMLGVAGTATRGVAESHYFRYSEEGENPSGRLQRPW